MRHLVSSFFVLFSLGVMVPSAHTQEHAASQAALDAAVQAHVASTGVDRERVQRLLEHPTVQAVAADIGVDLRRAQSAVSTFDANELARLAQQASRVEQALAGGQSSVTVSTTLIIIGLLVLILIIVAVG